MSRSASQPRSHGRTPVPPIRSPRRLGVGLRRLARRNLQRIMHLARRLRGYTYLGSARLEELLASQRGPERLRRPVVLVSFHTDGMYCLLRLADRLDRPMTCLVTAEARFLLRIMPDRHPNVRFVTRLEGADVRAIARAERYLLVFADVNTSGTKMVHVAVFGRFRIFSASWAVMARAIKARVVALTAVRHGRSVELDGLELDGESSPSGLVEAAFAYLQERLVDSAGWDMIVSHPLYPPVARDRSDVLADWRQMAACDLEVARMVARLREP